MSVKSFSEEDTASMVGSVDDNDTVLLTCDDISNYNREQVLPAPPESILKIRSWLHPTSYNDVGGEYRKHLASHLTGTGAWVTSSDVYQTWLQGDGDGEGLLWIKGIPGSGKSVLTAKLIDELARSNPGCPVLFFFFRQIIEANHKPRALLCEWMDQLLRYSPPLQKRLLTYVEANKPLDTLQTEHMWQDLRGALANLPGKAFCVADALDEMDHGQNMDMFLTQLASLGQWRPGRVKVLMTSRPVPVVDSPLRMVQCLHLRLRESLVDVDISSYVEYTLSTCDPPIRVSEKQKIRDAVPGRANGLFLYAKLAMDAFLRPDADIKQVLQHLPADLTALYNNLLEKHARRSDVSQDVQRLILQAITHTTRPLRLLELATMVKYASPDGLDGSTRDLMVTKDLVRAACGPLLEILPDESISVIHHSFTEFLRGTTLANDGSRYPTLQPGSSHSALALACLRYLESGCLEGVSAVIKRRCGFSGWTYRGPWNPFDGYDSGLVPEPDIEMRLQYPFAEYAVSYWHHHANKSESAGHDQTLVNSEIAKFLGDDKTRKAWLQLSWSDYSNEIHVTQLHIAARAGLVSYTKNLIGNIEVDVRDGLGKTPLWWAATEGHGEVLRVLLTAGANPDQGELQRGVRPLHQAAVRNHSEAVKILLEAGADPLPAEPRPISPGNSYSSSVVYAYLQAGYSPLETACLNGCLETVDVLLSHIQDINLTHRALAWAARGGQPKVVSSLLQYSGVDVNRKIDGLTPIYLACKASSAATVEILLEAGANPSVKCEDGGLNCLHQLCHVGASCIPNYADAKVLREIFMLLIRHGVDVNERTALGATALHGAVMGSAVLTRLLVDSGADGNAEDYEGLTPLYKVRGYNYGFGAPACRIPVDPIEILIEQGQADVNHVRPSGDTLLHWMLRELPSERTLTFLKYAPICNVLDQYGNSPLHNALRSGNLPVVEGLLKAGADPNMLSRDGLAPMFCLRDDYFSPELVDIFLGAGADLNTVDRNGKSILFHMLPTHTLLWDHKRALERFTALVNRGASTSIRDFEGRTVLHEIVQTLDARAAQRLHGRLPSKPVFDILADLGLGLKAVDYAGNSLLHEIAGRTDNHYKSSLLPPLWEYLLAMGLDLEERNNAGRTPLHILCGSAIDMCPPGLDRERLSPIDMLISRKVSVSATDHNGITPLHIAATRGEQCTKKLLDAGADATACTREGLTALHLASRSGRSNVVGMLLAALGRETSSPASTQSQPGASGAGLMKNQVKGVNASAYGRDEITPLFYACQSGRPETVALLIEAGADVELGSILQACAGFEGGDHLSQLSQWSKRRGDKLLLLDNICHASQAKRRHYESGPADFDVCTNETSRLQEILHMLIPLGTELSNPHHREKINASIDEAVSSGRDYTAMCLREARDKYLSGLANVNQEKVVSVLSGFMHHSLNEASVQLLNVSGLVRQGAANHELFRHFLRRREYHLVEELCLLGADFLRRPSDKQPCNLAILVRAGLCELVERTGQITAESELNKGCWHAYGDDTRPGLWFTRRDTSNSGDWPVPFLLEAVQRELPNLDMMRLLVEKFRVDVNEVRIGLGKVRVPNGMLRNTPVPTDSALHYAARGYSWWHAHEALPYLLKVGADTNLRSYNEDTPLHVALWRLNYNGPFAKDAARILVENGADVNAIGNDGRSCLACAADDVDMIRLLVRHGAALNSEALFAAIDANNVAGVRELLTLRLNPSMRRGKLTEEEFDANGMRIRPHSYVATRLTGVPLYHKVFPLYHAGMAQSLRQWRGPDESAANLECALKIIQLLLEHGADPFARFLSRINKRWEITAVSDTIKDTPLIEVPENHREGTILHELLIVGSVVDPFLNFPGLNVNCRDAKGRTLLNAACQSSAGPDVVQGSHEEQANRNDRVTMFQRLTSLGAEIRARDNSGRNVLHHMIAGNAFETTFDIFKHSFAGVLQEAPDLIHETDDDGQTPLHYAVSRADMSRDTRAAQALLQAGSDPLVVDKNANSLLHVLAKSLDAPAQVSLFQYLARRGVDINGRNEGGETPLFIFCRNDKSERRGNGDDTWQEVSGTQTLLMLREMGANLFIRDAKDRGLLHVAARNDARLFKELMDAGLDPLLEDKAQQTAIDVAAVSGNQDVLELFEKLRDR